MIKSQQIMMIVLIILETSQLKMINLIKKNKIYYQIKIYYNKIFKIIKKVFLSNNKNYFQTQICFNQKYFNNLY